MKLLLQHVRFYAPVAARSLSPQETAGSRGGARGQEHGVRSPRCGGCSSNLIFRSMLGIVYERK